ncbi:hypothetical protein CK203_037475 [Vitis vinifera]|uniref:Defective in cullin neddylation protein n=1 Tax=Vitis vinifera TaxID=29760 RepID=A0A438HDV4_VITVI|nr:hypothetical protein CK203_037475 [Vitis vinifera]
MQLMVSIFDELLRLMLRLDLTVDFSEFSRFYDFVFFMCRENSQKNITVSRAITAWRIALAGRFRLLNQWCDFVEFLSSKKLKNGKNLDFSGKLTQLESTWLCMGWDGELGFGSPEHKPYDTRPLTRLVQDLESP